MEDAVLLAIIFKKVEERLKTFSTPSRGPRGQRGARGSDGSRGQDGKDLKLEDLTAEQIEKLRGPRGRDGNDGRDGKDFDFTEHENTIKSWAEEFALKFDDLTAEQIEKLRGPRGRDGNDGRDGKDFDFTEHENTIKSWAEEFALKFDDLTAEQIEKLRGPRGRDGKEGKGFDFEENKDLITKCIGDLISGIQDSLRLKFSDLSAEDIEVIRGPRGRDGKDGKNFSFEEHKDFFLSLKPKFSDFTPEEIVQLKLHFKDLTDEDKSLLKLRFEDLTDEDRLKLKGARGARGQRGSAGRDGTNGKDGLSIRGLPGPVGRKGDSIKGRDGINGKDGQDGRDAPYIISIDVDQYSSNEFEFIFEFSDGTVIRSEPVKLPKGNVYFGGGGAASGNGGSGGDDTTVYQGFSARFNEAFDTVGTHATLLQILEFSYVAPLISLSSSVSTALREKGTVVASVPLSALTTKRSDAITIVEFYKDGSLIDTVPTPDPDGTTESYTDASGFSDTTSYYAKVSDGTSIVQSSTLLFKEVYPYYYGVGAPGLLASDVALLTKNIIDDTAIVARQFSPSSQVYYFAYPASYPALTSILDTNGFETISDWTVSTDDITGLDSNPVSYRIYEFNNLTTQTGFTNTFKQ